MKTFLGERMEDNWSVPYIPGGPGPAEILFTFVPEIGSVDDLRGQVNHVVTDDHKVAVYIRVSGGWWTKPYFSKPHTAIMCSGAFVCDITTGGHDSSATEIAAYLIPEEYDAPLLNGDSSIPQELMDNSLANVHVTRN